MEHSAHPQRLCFLLLFAWLDFHYKVLQVDFDTAAMFSSLSCLRVLSPNIPITESLDKWD